MFRHEPFECLSCGTDLNASFSYADKKAFATNDITICAHCGEMLVFQRNKTFRRATEKERNKRGVKRYARLAEEIRRRPDGQSVRQAVVELLRREKTRAD